LKSKIGNRKSEIGDFVSPARESPPGPRFLGIDIGSVSLNVAVVDADGKLVEGHYERTDGQPLPRLLETLRRLEPTVPEAAICGTGSGRPLLADLLGVPVQNEIVAHAWGAVRFHPEARTVIEIGGQDSKLILLEGRNDGRPLIADHAMNEICAAGTGSFLDQQAARLGVDIDGEFGALALRSEHPAAIAGRCSVFAKTDMIHLQQEGYPKEDIIAGLCYALARNYLSNLARGRRLDPPVLFQGGVAANGGVVRAFEHLLDLGRGGLIIPEHYRLMGAIGAALIARADGAEPISLASLIARLEEYLARPPRGSSALPCLRVRQNAQAYRLPAAGTPRRLFLGIDVGSVSTNIVLLDDDGGVHNELYLYTEGDPIETVRSGLAALGEALHPPPSIAAVGVTGSGRHLIGDFVGADLVVNEITAQARAARAIDAEADTVFEIGGQDSKFIRLRDGAVVDFEMNKVCAAGTGAFLAEQATRLDLRIKDGFSRLAFQAAAPVDLGSRCTVFMESDLIHHQQQGVERADLVAGLAYAIARNYLEKVVGHKPIGQRILFQGGVASNPSIVAAFEALLERAVTVPPHSRATGAIGAALVARDAAESETSAFRGFDLSGRSYRSESFQCQSCPNRCDIKKVILDGQTTSYHGSICGKYDIRTHAPTGPDLFAEREAMLLEGWLPEGPAPDAPTIGIPRILLFHELFPEWCAFFQSLGYRVVLSDPTNRHIINQSLEHVVVETCFPVKIAYGHVLDLVAKGAQRLFVPGVMELPGHEPHRKRYTCPYVQNVSSMLRSAFPGIGLLSPVITCAGRKSNWRKAMAALGRQLGHPRRVVDRALDAARRAQRRFEERRAQRGRQLLADLEAGQTAVVILGRPYNTCDRALSMQIPRKLRQLGAIPIPLDLLPLRDVKLDEAWDDVVWKIGRGFLAAASLIRRDSRLDPLLISNFGCGPDSFLLSTLEGQFAERPFLALELDEHFADAGISTRCEAFLHECRSRAVARKPDQPKPRRVHVLTPRHRRMDRTVYIPTPSEHFYAVWGAFRSMGIDVELLPPPDRRSEELGRCHTQSRGCLPFILFAGDAVRMTELPGFEPSRSAFALPGNDESCRINQFSRGLRQILDRTGGEDVLLVSPRVSMESAESFDVFGPKFEHLLWLALIAIDALGSKALKTRPYELHAGATDATFRRHVLRVAEAIGRRDFLDTVVDALRAIDGIEVAARGTRPRIGIVGERYAQSNTYVNNNLPRQIEDLGGEVSLAPFYTDYLRVQGRQYPKMLLRMRRLADAFVACIRHVVQQRDYDKLERLFAPFLDGERQPTVREFFQYASPYVTAAMEVPVLMHLANSVDFALKGCAGLVCLLPHGCLMASVAAASFPRLRARHGGIPVLTLAYDGLQDTNQRTRLQAFMHQAVDRPQAARHALAPAQS